MGQVLRMTITIELPDGVTVQSESGAPSPAVGDVQGDDPESTADHARMLLGYLGFDNPDDVLSQYRPERIIEVCQAVGERRDALTNPAGYVNTALRKGWKFPAARGGQEGGAP